MIVFGLLITESLCQIISPSAATSTCIRKFIVVKGKSCCKAIWWFGELWMVRCCFEKLLINVWVLNKAMVDRRLSELMNLTKYLKFRLLIVRNACWPWLWTRITLRPMNDDVDLANNMTKTQQAIDMLPTPHFGLTYQIARHTYDYICTLYDKLNWSDFWVHQARDW